jgi:hypothetical protein
MNSRCWGSEMRAPVAHAVVAACGRLRPAAAMITLQDYESNRETVAKVADLAVWDPVDLDRQGCAALHLEQVLADLSAPELRREGREIHQLANGVVALGVPTDENWGS